MLAVHVPVVVPDAAVHAIPDGEDVTVPGPLPAIVTVSCRGGCVTLNSTWISAGANMSADVTRTIASYSPGANVVVAGAMVTVFVPVGTVTSSQPVPERYSILDERGPAWSAVLDPIAT